MSFQNINDTKSTTSSTTEEENVQILIRRIYLFVTDFTIGQVSQDNNRKWAN